MDLTDKRLLVVDDNPANVELLEALLEDHGFARVEGLCDPRRVLAICRRERPDLILLDIRMPHLDGFQVLEQLEAGLDGGAPPVIVLTAQIDDLTRRRALGLGVRDFLVKPLKHDEVMQRLRNVLTVQHRYQVRDRQADDLERLVAERTRELERQSRTDPVTGLPNRRGLIRYLDELLGAQRAIGLLFVALDGLDDCVQLHGYGVTERLLKAVGESLQARLEAPRCVGLWGGGELLVIVPDLADPAALERLAGDIVVGVHSDHRVGDLLVALKARIGIHLARAGIPERLVQMAALALPQGHDRRLQCYSSRLEVAQQQRLKLQQALRGAVERREVSLLYQPKVALTDGRILGAEALLRWHHPRLGQILPGDFIPLAEASGDILALGDWAIEEAITQAVRWRNDGLLGGEFDIAINVAPRQLAQEGFATRLLARLAHHRLPSRFLSLEVTESGLMVDLDRARHELGRVSRAGVRVAIDDFGTGYSSLAYLRTLPVSILKVDRAFVSDLVEDPEDRRLLSTVIGLAHGFGCEVVAEGIETAGQARLLERMGCEIGQGFLYSPPLTAEAFARRCREQSRVPVSFCPLRDD